MHREATVEEIRASLASPPRRDLRQSEPEPARAGRVESAEDYYPQALRDAAEKHNARIAAQREAIARTVREQSEIRQHAN